MSNEYKEWLEDEISELPSGWEKLYWTMREELGPILEEEGLADRFCFLQVKEKYGQLVCYGNMYNEKVEKVIAKYREQSRHTCVRCGRPVEKIKDWSVPVCSECMG